MFRALVGVCPVEDLSPEFTEKFYINKPSFATANKRAKELIKKKNKKFGNLAASNTLVFNVEKKSGNLYSYGTFTIRKTEFVRCVNVHSSLANPIKFPPLKAYPNFWTTDTVPVVCTVIHAMPLRDRLLVLKSPELKALKFDASIARYAPLIFTRLSFDSNIACIPASRLVPK